MISVRLGVPQTLNDFCQSLPNELRTILLRHSGIDNRRALGIRPGRLVLPPGLAEKISKKYLYRIIGKQTGTRTWCFVRNVFWEGSQYIRTSHTEYVAEQNVVTSVQRHCDYHPKCVLCRSDTCLLPTKWVCVHRRERKRKREGAEPDIYCFRGPCESYKEVLVKDICIECGLPHVGIVLEQLILTAVTDNGLVVDHADSFHVRPIGHQLFKSSDFLEGEHQGPIHQRCFYA